MGNTLLPNNPTLDDIKKLIKKINSKIKIINASVNQETLNIDSPIATIIQSESTDPGEYTTTDIDTNNFYTKNEINTLLENKVNVASIKDMAYINDAPSDNKDYARKNGIWSEITNSGISEWGNISGTLSDQTDLNAALNAKANFTDLGDMATVNDAPSDGVQYARKDGQWTVVTGSGGSGNAAWGEITGALSDQTDLKSALDGKANASSVYSKTDSDALLLAKANTADLGGMATVNDAPSDNKNYARKNGAWAEVTGGGSSEWGNITGTLSDQTDLNTALSGKADTSTVYTKTEADNLLSAKANTADLGDLAAEDDAPSDNTQYARKNGQWDQIATPAWGTISGTLSTQTDLQSALESKVDSNAVYLKSETDTLLSAKANTTDLGDLAIENDAPSDNSEYVRKNGAWAVASGGGAAWGAISGTLTDQTDLNTALNAKQNTLTFDSAPTSGSSNPVTSDGINSALSSKANTADLGDMASVDDAPSDGKNYARKNGRWSEVTSSGGGGGGGASAILYNDTGATMLAGTIVYAEETSNRLEAHKADSACDRRLYILNDDVADREEVQASFVPGSIANVLCDSYAVDEGDSLVIGSTAGQATAADDNGTIGIAMGAKASGSIGIVKVRLTENRTVKAVNKSATSNLPGHVYRIISGDAVGIPLAESAAKGKQPFGVQANLQSNTDGYVLLKYQPGETAMVLADSTEIQVGDWLVPSYDTPGRVRAGNGYGIGRAMTSKLAGSVGSVKCLLMPGQYGISPRCWYLPSGITEDQVLAAYQFVKRNSKAEALININNGIEYPLTENGTVEWNSETGIYLPAGSSNGLIQATLNNLYTNIKSGGFGFAGVSSSAGIHGGILINTTRTLMVNTVISDGRSAGNYSAGFSVSNTSSTAYRHSNVISAGVATADWMQTPKLYLDGLSVSLSAVSTYGSAVSENSITLGHINRPASNNRDVYFTAFVLYNAYLEAAQHLELSQNIHHLGGIEA